MITNKSVQPSVGIYKSTSPSGKIYIGQSWNIKHRWYVYRGSNCKGQPHLNASFEKYGARNHNYEILHLLPLDVNQSVLDIYEILYIDLYKSAKIPLLNLKDGGLGGKHSALTKSKISLSQKGKRKANSGSFKKGDISRRIGKLHSLETKLKISKSQIGRPGNSGSFGKGRPIPAPTPERNKAVSDGLKGIKRPYVSEQNVKIHTGNKYNLGIKRSDETKRKISQAKKGKPCTPEHIAKRSAAVKEWWRQRKSKCNL